MAYNHISTNYDTMHELYIRGAELTQAGFPILKPCYKIPKKSVDLSESKKVKARDCKETNVHFYLSDSKIGNIWNDAEKWLNHFRCFHSICGIDYTIDEQMPFVMQTWNKYRNNALAYYYQSNGVNVIPHVNILSVANEFIYDGLPTESVLSCSTNGRVKNKQLRLDFCDGFCRMIDRLNPIHVCIIGREIPELETDTPITYFETTSMKRYEELKNGR